LHPEKVGGRYTTFAGKNRGRRGDEKGVGNVKVGRGEGREGKKERVSDLLKKKLNIAAATDYKKNSTKERLRTKEKDEESLASKLSGAKTTLTNKAHRQKGVSPARDQCNGCPRISQNPQWQEYPRRTGDSQEIKRHHPQSEGRT